MEDAPKKFFRLAPGREVRLRWAYYITCTDVIKNDAGEIIELRCSYDPLTKGGDSPDGRKVKGTLHWVSAKDAIDAEVRLYDHMFLDPNPGKSDDFVQTLNPHSLEVLHGCKLEPSILNFQPDNALQFERMGYFVKDQDSTAQMPVFNRTMSLRDTWAKIQSQS